MEAHLSIFACFISLCFLLQSSTAIDTIAPNQNLRDNGETLVSVGGNFELGFFSPWNSNDRYIGIWFKNIPQQTVFWVANRNNPLTDASGVLTITATGNVSILRNQSSVPAVWSSNSSTTTSRNPVLQLLENGNLVVKDGVSENYYLWQSFDHPCDTLIPGMKLGLNLQTGNNWYLSSWKSLQDPSTGDYTYKLDHKGLPQFFLRKGTEIVYRTAPWDGVRFGGDRRFDENAVFNPIFVVNNEFIYYSFENIDKSTVSRFVLNQTGVIEHLSWNQRRGEWVVIMTLQTARCEEFELCGPNGFCNMNRDPICYCPSGFTPRVAQDWNVLDWSGGCVARTSWNCSSDTKFRRFTGLKLPDNSEFVVNISIPVGNNKLMECEEECLRNCSYVAYATYTSPEVSRCVAWFGSLKDVREYSQEVYGQDLYVRMAASELESKNNGKRTAVIVSTSVASGVLLLLLILTCCYFTGKRVRNKSPDPEVKNLHEFHPNPEEEDLDLPLFDWLAVASATNDFAFTNKIGEGGFGPVYRGKLPTGQDIAVKRRSKDSGQGLKEFKNEVIFIAKLQHRNLVRLLGCCIYGEERMLIYEYMPNRSLDLYIFDKARGTSLDWQKRYDIIVGVARGLVYLHRDSRLRIIHRDLKASNILLDGEMNPRISDFGLARTFGDDRAESNTSRIMGTYGYMSPEYQVDGLFSVKSDVFSFGVLVLEIVSGKRNRGFYHPDHDLNLLGHAWKLWNEGMPMELIDPSMKQVCALEVLRCVQMGLLCVQQRSEDRPTMSSVLLMLDSENPSLPQPKRPGFYTERSLTETDTSSTGKITYNSNEVTISMLQVCYGGQEKRRNETSVQAFSLLICTAVDTITSEQSISDGEELLSSGGSFILGFFSPSQSKHRYLGIWYKNIFPQTIVWVGNRGRPINDSYGRLTFSADDGNLILLNGGGNIIWSSSSNPTRSAKEPTAKLLNSGNLVLFYGTDSGSDGYVWQSFDYPCDTLLPGMKLGWDAKTGLHRQLTSWKTAADPSPGNFTFSIDISVPPQFVLRQGLIKKYRTGIWNGVRFNSNFWKSTSNVFVPTFTLNSNEVTYMDRGADNTNSILVMSYNGLAQRYVWDKVTLQSIIIYEARKDRCDNYGICGPNSICNSYDLPVLCECLTGFVPRSQEEWDAFNWAGGCIRETPLNCSKQDGFLELKSVKLPDLLQFWTDEKMNLKECREECLKNCSCAAYANLNVIDGGQGCLVWFGDLYDMKLLITEAGDDEQDLHIRLAASDIESTAESSKKKRQKTMMIVIILVVSGVLVLVGFVVCFIIKKGKQKNEVAGTRDNLNNELELPLFSLVTMMNATDNFCCENKLGEGGFGPVYKGILADGQEIAAKRLSETSEQGVSEFKNEVMLVAKLQHRNLVKILGVCIEGEERMVIYEHMANRSLDQFIFDPIRSKVLDWKRRLDIIVGISRGLLYLHQDSRQTIIHRDLKTSNILLDTAMNPKISDFGMARIFEGDQSRIKTKRIAGTYGYMSPEYGIHGLFSVKSDVYSFGVIVLEILSGMKNRIFQHPDHHHNLLGHAWILWKEGRPLDLFDANLDSSKFECELLKFMQVGLLCVQRAPEDRPTMSNVVFMLSNEGLTLPEPKHPGFFIDKCPGCYTMEEYCTRSAVTITLVAR